jgi:hypothetical protein
MYSTAIVAQSHTPTGTVFFGARARGLVMETKTFNPSSVANQICLGILVRIGNTGQPVKTILMQQAVFMQLSQEPEFHGIVLGLSRGKGYLAGVPIFVEPNIKTNVELV